MRNQDEEDDFTIQQIREAIGKKVSFKYPEAPNRTEGILKDRTIMRANPASTGVPYWDVVDLIEFSGEPEPKWIRIGYYRKPAGRLVWGSQTTITEPVDVWKKLLVTAASEKPWFRKLLEEVMEQLQEPVEKV